MAPTLHHPDPRRVDVPVELNLVTRDIAGPAFPTMHRGAHRDRRHRLMLDDARAQQQQHLKRPMGPRGHSWGPTGPWAGVPWGPMGAMRTMGGAWGTMGIHGDPWGPMDIHGDTWGPMEIHCEPCGGMANHGHQWGPRGSMGIPRGPVCRQYPFFISTHVLTDAGHSFHSKKTEAEKPGVVFHWVLRAAMGCSMGPHGSPWDHLSTFN